MVVTEAVEFNSGDGSTYDRVNELKAFDETKTGVQGLIENGVTKVPPIFYNGQAHDLNEGSATESNSKLTIPIIDLKGIHDDSIQRDKIVGEIRNACENWGFFQITNHGIPPEVLDEMIKGTRRFHEQDANVRKEYYTRDFTKKVAYVSNFTLYISPVDWRDSLAYFMGPDPPKPEELPPVCSDIVIDYTKKVKALASTLFELLSEGLGLKSSYLKEMGCAEGLLLIGHYYPACPEPEKTIGTTQHTDSDFLTILLQDQMGGLQFLHQNQWINVTPIHGALIVNTGDLLQLVTNARFKSVLHRVLANNAGPRISVASLFRPHNHPSAETSKIFGPIKELLSEQNPPVYRDVSLKEYLVHCYSKGITSTIDDFKL